MIKREREGRDKWEKKREMERKGKKTEDRFEEQ